MYVCMGISEVSSCSEVSESSNARSLASIARSRRVVVMENDGMVGWGRMGWMRKVEKEFSVVFYRYMLTLLC